MYDYIIVGSGLYGAIFAHEVMKAGKSCLVVERRAYRWKHLYKRDGRNPGASVWSTYFPHK